MSLSGIKCFKYTLGNITLNSVFFLFLSSAEFTRVRTRKSTACRGLLITAILGQDYLKFSSVRESHSISGSARGSHHGLSM